MKGNAFKIEKPTPNFLVLENVPQGSLFLKYLLQELLTLFFFFEASAGATVRERILD